MKSYRRYPPKWGFDDWLLLAVLISLVIIVVVRLT